MEIMLSVKKILYLFFLAVSFVLTESCQAQSSGTQDSTGIPFPDLRPRRDTYIIVPYPSPAMHGVTMTIQIYNHNAQQIAVHIEDVNGKVVKELQPPAMLPNGIHNYPFQTNSVATGTYHIRLITYTTGGAEDTAQDLQFIVVH